MVSVKIVRHDSITPVTIEPAKHAWWQGQNDDVFVVATGEHGKDRVYWQWPARVIDHVVVTELYK